MSRVGRIVTGGQTGVDRAALDVAAALGIPLSGWVPLGGWAEDLPDPPGVIALYPMLRESDSADPAVRTSLNVRDADATLVLAPVGMSSPGTDHTVDEARRSGRPVLVVDPSGGGANQAVESFLDGLGEAPALNVAGPRASEWPDAHDVASRFLFELLSRA